MIRDVNKLTWTNISVKGYPEIKNQRAWYEKANISIVNWNRPFSNGCGRWRPSKIDTTFADLDNDDNRYISREEADDDEIFAHFSIIDVNSDMIISPQEFNNHFSMHPHHFDGDGVASV